MLPFLSFLSCNGWRIVTGKSRKLLGDFWLRDYSSWRKLGGGLYKSWELKSDRIDRCDGERIIDKKNKNKNTESNKNPISKNKE